MNVYTSKDTVFYNSQCLFVEYYDVIKCPWFVLLNCIQQNEEITKIFDIMDIKDFEPESLFEWYINRKHRNFFKDFPLLLDQDKLPEDFYHSFLEEQMKSDKRLFDIDTELAFTATLKVITTQKQLVKKIIIYSEEENPFVREDCKSLFGNNIEVVFGDLKEVLEKIPNDSTFVFSDIEKINTMIEANKLNLSSLIICNNYRYNNKDKKTLKIDIDNLSKKYTFKINFFDNLPKK